MVVTGSKREGGCGSLDKSFKVYSHTQTQIQGNVERNKKNSIHYVEYYDEKNRKRGNGKKGSETRLEGAFKGVKR